MGCVVWVGWFGFVGLNLVWLFDVVGCVGGCLGWCVDRSVVDGSVRLFRFWSFQCTSDADFSASYLVPISRRFPGAVNSVL